MFPRPSRFLRLAFFASTLALFLLIFYFVQNDYSAITRRNNNVFGIETSQHRHVLKANPNFGLFYREDDTMKDKTSQRSSNNDDLEKGQGETGVQRSLQFEGSVRSMLQKAEELNSMSDQNGRSSDRPLISPDVVNPHNFQYLHNPSKVCTRVLPRLLIYIHSSPANLKKRQSVRQTWGHHKILGLYNATLVFVLGGTNPSVQALIDLEAEQYGDILQEDFHDSYRNLTHKGVASLKWISTYCKKAEFLLKTDDDILIDIVSLLEHFFLNVIPLHGTSKLVLCNLWTRMKVLRDIKSKWYISKEEFPHEYFPPYCSGSAFFLSGDLIEPLYRTALRTPFFWVDDYYVTGSLVNQLKVSHVRLNPAYLMDYTVVEERLRNDSKDLMIFHVRKLSKYISLWPKLVQRHPGMMDFLQDVFTSSVESIRDKLLSASVKKEGDKYDYGSDTRYGEEDDTNTKPASKFESVRSSDSVFVLPTILNTVGTKSRTYHLLDKPRFRLSGQH